MFNFYPIYRRELKSYFSSPAVYVVAAMYFFLAGLFFYGILDNFSYLSGNAQKRKEMGIDTMNFTQLVVSQLFWSINFLLLFVVPIFTMRLLAEEKKSGTFELLKSLPFTDWSIVIAKFLAAYSLIVIMLLVNGYFVLVMARFGKPELPVVGVAFVGVLIASAGYVAIGLFASAVTENQIVAAIVGFVVLLGLFLIGDVTMPASTGVSHLLGLISMRHHSDQFTRGLLRGEDIAYFAMIVGIFLFLTSRTLELRRWKI
jgi:ABC-2 type transport system permease protein